MKYKIEKLRRLFQFWYEVLFTILLMDFLLIIFVKEQPVWYAPFMIVLIYFMSYGIRRWSPNYGITMLTHVILAAILYFLPISTGAYVVYVLIVFYILSDAIVYMKRNGVLMPISDFPWPTFVISIVIYIFGYYTKSTLITYSAYYIPVILLIMYLVMLYLEGLYKYVEATKDVTGLPMKNIIFTNTMIVMIVLVLILVGIAFGKILHFDQAIIYFGKLLLNFIRFVGSILVFYFRVISSLLTTGEAEQISYEMMGNKSNTTSPNVVVSILENVGKLLFVVVFLFMIYQIMSKIIRFLFVKRNQNLDVIEKVETKGMKKQISTMLSGRKRRAVNDEEKLRMLYRTKIEYYKYEISLSKEKTAREIEKQIEEKEIGNVKELTDIYSDVRYGGKKVDGKLIKKVKKMM